MAATMGTPSDYKLVERTLSNEKTSHSVVQIEIFSDVVALLASVSNERSTALATTKLIDVDMDLAVVCHEMCSYCCCKY